MEFKKPKFWDYKKPNVYSYLLWPISILIRLFNFLKILITRKNYSSTKTICVGNIYLGGTGKTSLSLKINEILRQKKIKTCFIKKFYSNQIDEQNILEDNGKLFKNKKRFESLKQAAKEGYKIAIFDDGLQDFSINYDLNIVCFNNINWIGNGLTIPSGPLRESINDIKKYRNVFLNGNNEDLDEIKKYIFKIDPTINVYQGKYVPKNLNEFNIKDKFLVFSGIGNHATFISMLKINKFNIVKEIEFPDHYEYSKKDINNIISTAKDLDCKIITTEKDYARLKIDNFSDIKHIKVDLEILNEEIFLKEISKLYEQN
jgi:tetraacyldisaccharide 4'-kinase